MPDPISLTLFGLLEAFRAPLTRPGFANFLVLFAGWVMTSGTHAVTEALVVTGVAGRRHHEAFHRFFSRGTWKPDELAHALFVRLERIFTAESPVRIVIDDTMTPKKGPNVFGIGTHLDAVRSTRRQKIFSFGHCWVVLAVVLPVPFSSRPWALPILFRLYRNKKECERNGARHRKKTELAREMVDVFSSWVPHRRVELAADCAYCNDTVTRGLPSSVVLFGAMRPDAVLTAPPPKRAARGRPRVRGHVLPKPEELARDPKSKWLTCSATLYGRRTRVKYKTCDAQWYRACGTRLLRIVIVRVTDGALSMRVYFCSDPTLSVREILEGYARRWPVEVCFRDLKQLLGFADSSARKREAVERVAPFVGLVYSSLVLWFTRGVHLTPVASPPVRPWYTHKRGHSFADVLRAAQRVLQRHDILDPASIYGNLDDSPRGRRHVRAGGRPPDEKAA